MPIIRLVTEIKAPIHICFDLARSIDLHKLSTAHTKEKAVGGVTSGLISLGEEVTWQATHFGIRQKLTSKITAFEFPVYFRDEMVKGIFRKIEHDHRFEQKEETTIMTDQFEYESPGGMVGHVFNTIVLTRYLKRLLIKRNNMIKNVTHDIFVIHKSFIC